MRGQLEALFEASTGVDEFVHGLMAFLVDLSREYPNHPMLHALGEELARASSAPLTASAMHDLRSILQGVSMGLEYAPVLLKRSGLLDDKPVDKRRVGLLLEAIDDARSGSQMAAQLATEVLSVQRDCMSPKDQIIEQIHLNEVIETAARLGGRLAPLQLRLETSADLEVRASRSALTRVLVNLLRNAAHAIDELEVPGMAGVTISSWASDEFAFVQVADDGPGIPEAVAAAIFDLFFTTHAEGTGIGLYVCKTLVSGWGGMIHVDSHDGEGSRFTFSIPKATIGGGVEV